MGTNARHLSQCEMAKKAEREESERALAAHGFTLAPFQETAAEVEMTNNNNDTSNSPNRGEESSFSSSFHTARDEAQTVVGGEPPEVAAQCDTERSGGGEPEAAALRDTESSGVGEPEVTSQDDKLSLGGAEPQAPFQITLLPYSENWEDLSACSLNSHDNSSAGVPEPVGHGDDDERTQNPACYWEASVADSMITAAGSSFGPNCASGERPIVSDPEALGLQQEAVRLQQERQAIASQKESQQEVQAKYCRITDRSQFHCIQEWCWKGEHTDFPKGSKLRKLLQGQEGAGFGICFQVPEGKPRDDDRHAKFDAGELSMIRLMDYCDMNPVNGRSFLDDFLKLVGDEMEKRDFKPGQAPTRSSVAKRVIQMYGEGGEPEVAQVTVSQEGDNPVLHEESKKTPRGKASTSEDGYLGDSPEIQDRCTVNCISFNVKRYLIDLLEDIDIFGNLDNLVVNQPQDGNPFAPYKNVSGKIDEVLDGTWYHKTLKRLRNFDMDPFVDTVDFLLPIVIYCDKTGTSINQRYPLEPFLFTTAIIKRELRNNPRSWRPAGFVPDLETKSSAEKEKINRQNKGATAQSYHLSLSHILKGFQEIQDEGVVTWLRLGPYRKKVRLRPEIAFVIGDGKSADMLTCRIPSWHGDRRISRCCTTLQMDCDQVQLPCKFVKKTEKLERLFDIVGMSSKAVRDHSDQLVPSDSGSIKRKEGANSVWMDLVEESSVWSDVLSEESDIDIGGGLRPVGGRRGTSRGTSQGGSKDKEKSPPEETTFRKKTEAEAKETIVMAKEALSRRSFHPARNAFLARCIRFGLDPRNIWGANPIDLMHAFQSGIVMYIVKMTMDSLPNGRKVRLDRLVHKMFHRLRCKEKTEGFPRMSFSKGFSKLTLLTSDEWAGKLFVILLVLNTEEGKLVFKGTQIFGSQDIELPRSFFNDEVDTDLQTQHLQDLANNIKPTEASKKSNKKKEEEEEMMVRGCSVADFVELAEALLCFHAWYKLGAHVMVNGKLDRKAIHQSISRMLAMVRYYTPRQNGNGWKIQKFHDILHIAIDIQRFGSPKNFDAGPHESGLKFWAKLPALTSQKRGYNIFAAQVASRLYEFLCLARARREHGIIGVKDEPFVKRTNGKPTNGKDDCSVPDDGVDVLKGTAYRVYGNRPEGVTAGHVYEQSVRLGSAKTAGAFIVHPLIEKFLRGQTTSDDLVTTIDPQQAKGKIFWLCRTECSMMPRNLPDRLTFRCHPNFRNEGPWYDWAIVDFEPGSTHFEMSDSKGTKRKTSQYPYHCVPSKILAFCTHPQTKKIMALVHACKFRTNVSDTVHDSVLLEHWELDYEAHDRMEQFTDFVVGKDGKEHLSTKRKKRARYLSPRLCWIALESIVARCLVVEQNPGIHEEIKIVGSGSGVADKLTYVILVRDHKLWPHEFT